MSLEAPVPPPASPPQAQAPWVYWHRPSEGRKLIGLGRAAMFFAQGEDRFARLHDQYLAAQSHWTHISQGKIKSRPRAFLGYGFDPQQSAHPIWQSYPPSQLYIPGLLVEWRHNRCVLIFTCLAEAVRDLDLVISNWLRLVKKVASPAGEPDRAYQPVCILQNEPDEASWVGRVERAKHSISQGYLDKVVLSRRISVQSNLPVSMAGIFSVLKHKYSSCTLLAANFGGASLIAATPERLCKVRSGMVMVDALAGTAAVDDMSPRVDMQHYEHAPVVRAIEQALKPLCQQLEFPKQPKRMPLGNLQHLWTPVKGRLKGDVSLFQLLDKLHPTPAVGGVPRDRACNWISRKEDWRGWYTGGFGWIGDNCEGDAVVLLRCALLDGRKAELFAGAGITSASVPADELNETRMKFEAMLGALKGT